MSFEKAIESFLRRGAPGHRAEQRRGEAHEVAAMVVFLCSQPGQLHDRRQLSRRRRLRRDRLTDGTAVDVCGKGVPA